MSSAYLAGSWDHPLPLPAGAKYPPPDGYTGADGKTPATSEVERWADHTGNWALRAPQGVVGLDVDHYTKGSVVKRGAEHLADVEARLGPLPDAPWSSKREWPSGIRFYRLPEPARLAGVACTDVEVIQRHHRYAVVAPSVVDGAEYVWHAPGPDGEVLDGPPAVADLPVLPAAWFADLKSRGSAYRASASDSDRDLLLAALGADDGEPCAAVERLLDRAGETLGAADPGSRHDAATTLAFQLVALGAEGHTGYGGALERLTNLFADATAGEHRPGELARLIGGAATKIAVEHPLPEDEDPCDPASDFADALPPLPPLEGADAPPQTVFPRLDLEALLDPDRPPRRWFWEGLVPEGDQASIVAPGGVGKSLLVLALCLAAVSGADSFIGRRLDFDGKVCHIDMENSEDDWHDRLRDLGWTQETVQRVAERYIPISLPPMAGLDTRRGADQLKATLRGYGVGRGDVVVLDSTQRVTEGEENSNDTLRALYHHTSAWLKAAGITVIRTDNTGWDTGRERGASAKRDDVGYAHLLERVGPKAEGRFRLVNTKHRSSGTATTLTFTRGLDACGHLAFTPATGAAMDFTELTQAQQDTLLSAWMLTTPGDARYESDAVSQTRILAGVNGKAKVLRSGIEQLVSGGLLVKVPILKKDGEAADVAPKIQPTAEGLEWVSDQGEEWVEQRLEQLARFKDGGDR